MFKIFPFSFSGSFNLNQLGQLTNEISGVLLSVLENIDMDELSKQYKESISNIYEDEEIEDETSSFIEFEEYDDMYLLTLDLMGIDIRELSIRYDQGVIAVNLYRSEIQNSKFMGYNNNTIVKKQYSKTFENIEEIDTNKLIKSIDDGIYKISMPKKYAIYNTANIVDVESINDQENVISENNNVIEVKNFIEN